MNIERRRDLIINGFGSSNGGQFEEVVVNGKGTIQGDVACEYFECSGAGTLNGDLKTGKLKISGKGKLNGNIDANDIAIDGHASIGGNVNFESTRVSGHCSIGGGIKGETLKINGKTSIGGDCEVEQFITEGIFTIGGLLNAEDIDIILYGECKAKEIGGQSIRIRENVYGRIKLIKTLFPIRLITDIIEGDDILLEGVKAKMVRGNNVAIGPHCEIDIVEYKDQYSVDQNAKVGKAIML